MGNLHECLREPSLSWLRFHLLSQGPSQLTVGAGALRISELTQMSASPR